MIDVINLQKSFGGNKVLKGVNLTIGSGVTQLVIGRSGCGKSVLLKHIIGIMRPDSGQVIVDGQDVTKLSGKELSSLRVRCACRRCSMTEPSQPARGRWRCDG